MRRHFHSVRLLGGPPPACAGPLVIYLNHASWWDPMICIVLRNRFFGERMSFAPIDAAALEKYRFFRKLGFFPVEQNSTRGAATFLEGAAKVLARENAALWLTPQGRFADVRERPLAFRSGLAHLAARVPKATYLPLAIEYGFWDERMPEVCSTFGEPLLLTSAQARESRTDVVNRELERRLEDAQTELAQAMIGRDASRFQVLMETGSGVGGVYDLWRGLKALARGRKHQPGHGAK